MTHEKSKIEVAPNATEQEWLKSFKYQNVTYHLSLVNPQEFQTGVNAIYAYVTEQNADKAKPWQVTNTEFVIELTPTMPDMGDHSSPDNQPLTRQSQVSMKVSLT